MSDINEKFKKKLIRMQNASFKKSDDLMEAKKTATRSEKVELNKKIERILGFRQALDDVFYHFSIMTEKQ